MAAENNGKKNLVIRNVMSKVLYQAVVIVMGLIIPKLFLETFGSETNGLVSTVRQIFSYFLLLEAGVGLASQQALYKPIAMQDEAGISGILSATRIHYNKAGVLYAAVTVIFAVVYPFAVATEIPGSWCFLIVLFYGIPAILSFFIQGKYRIFLEGIGRGYVLTNLSTVMHLVNCALKIVVLIYTKNLLLVQAIYCLEPFLQIILVLSYTKKNFPWLDLKAKPDFKAISQKNYVLLHQISGIVFNNTDAILISLFCGFKAVSVYTIYMMFFQYVDTIITSVTSGFTYRLGQIFQTEKERFKRYFDAYEAVFITATFIIFTLMATFLLPVIKLYTGGVTDVDYYNPLLLVMFAVMKLLTNSKIPCNDVINFEGMFEQTKHHAVLEAVINIVVSVIAIRLWGITGGIVGTVVALLYRGNIMIYYANRKILGRSLMKTYRKYIANFIIFTVILLVLRVDTGAADTFIGVFIKAAIHALWITPLYLGVNMALEYKCLGAVKEIGRSLRG